MQNWMTGADNNDITIGPVLKILYAIFLYQPTNAGGGGGGASKIGQGWKFRPRLPEFPENTPPGGVFLVFFPLIRPGAYFWYKKDNLGIRN